MGTTISMFVQQLVKLELSGVCVISCQSWRG